MHIGDRFSSFSQRRRGLVVPRLDNEAVVYHSAHHAMCYLNATAPWVWDRADGRTSVANMAPPPGESQGSGSLGSSAQAKADSLAKEASQAELIERNVDDAVDALIERGLLDIVLEHPSQCS